MCRSNVSVFCNRQFLICEKKNCFYNLYFFKGMEINVPPYFPRRLLTRVETSILKCKLYL